MVSHCVNTSQPVCRYPSKGYRLVFSYYKRCSPCTWAESDVGETTGVRHVLPTVTRYCQLFLQGGSCSRRIPCQNSQSVRFQYYFRLFHSCRPSGGEMESRWGCSLHSLMTHGLLASPCFHFPSVAYLYVFLCPFLCVACVLLVVSVP